MVLILGSESVFFGVPFDSEGNEAVDQCGIWNSRGFPQLRIHADGGETRKRVDLIHVELSRGAFEEQVDAGHAGTLQNFECGNCHLLRMFHVLV